MNAKEIDASIKAMNFLKNKASDMEKFLKECKAEDGGKFVSMTDLKTDIGRWEYRLAQIIEEATGEFWDYYEEESE